MNTKEFRNMFPTILSSTLSDSFLDSVVSAKSGLSNDTHKSEIKDGKLNIEFSLPGLAREDISVSFEANKLTLEINRSNNWNVEDIKAYLISEKFNTDGASAEMKNGVLEIKIPERSKKGSKKIQIT
jgi:HSP20 family molecular chaperone IbpA